MGYFRKLSAAASLLLCFLESGVASGQSPPLHCDRTDRETWADLSSAWWAGPTATTGRPVVFVIAAPWCPTCAAAFRTYGSRQYSFDMRFIPVQGFNDRNRNQIADMVVDGGLQALRRVYLQNTFDVGQISPEQRDFIDEVQWVVDFALSRRYESKLNFWGSPIHFLLHNGKILAQPGTLNFAKVEGMKNGLASAPGPSTTRRFISAGVGQEHPVTGRPTAIKAITPIRALPDDNAFISDCLQRGDAYGGPAGSVKIDGKTWLVFRPYKEDKRSHWRVYARGDDFANWRLR